MAGAMKLRLTIAAVALGAAVALAACGEGGPRVDARQTGDTTTTTAPEPTTTAAAPTPTTAAPDTTAAPPPTAPQLPCAPELLAAASASKFGSAPPILTGLKCVEGWATSAQANGFNPPTYTLYKADGDHWVAVNRSAGRLCAGHDVPAEVAPQIGCDT
jgi:hypothetical protein